MSDKLYRWIKVSERLPEKETDYFVKVFYHRGQCEVNRIAIFENNRWFIREKYGPEDVLEWLEELPSSVEEEAVEYWKKRCEAAEEVIKYSIDHTGFPKVGFSDANKKWQQLKQSKQ